MNDAGRKLIDALQEAVDGKFTRVRMPDGSTWVPEPQWQPIETAPKDGTPIIGYWNGYKRPCVMWWNEVGRAFESWTDRKEIPSHWMPLPEPPVAA